MHKILASIALTAFLLPQISTSPAVAAPADDAVAAALAKWTDAFAKADGDAIAALYAKDALFFGSTPPLYKGVDGVKAYFQPIFKSLPPNAPTKVEFSDLSVSPVGDDVINLAATASFTINNAPTPRVYRLTQVFVREGGAWKILSHHVSPKAP